MEKMREIRQQLMDMNPLRTEEEAQAIIDDMSMIIVDKETSEFEMSPLETLLDRGIEIWGDK